MHRSLAVLLLCIVGFVLPASPAHAAGPTPITLAGNLAFLTPTDGWVEVSSSAGYDQFCNRSLSPPRSCNQATTTIYDTRDAGRSWQRVLRFSSQKLGMGVDALPSVWMHRFDGRHALVLAEPERGRGILYRTTDGRSWTHHPLPASVGGLSATDIAFAGQHDLWLLAHKGAAAGSEVVAIYRTVDAGDHWTQVACTALSTPVPANGCRLRSGIGFGGHKDNIVFVSGSTGFLVNNNFSGIPFLYVTHDGGTHWQTRSTGLPAQLPHARSNKGLYPYAELEQPLFVGNLGILPARVTVCRANNGKSCGTVHYVLLSHDGGRSWPAARRFPFVTDRPAPVWQVLTPTTWLAINGSTLWSTTDAGAHWTAVHASIPAGFTPEQIQFLTPANGWMIVAKIYQPDGLPLATRLLRTTDGGKHWSVVSLPTH